VIEWHEQGLLPLGEQLTEDPRCRFVDRDFFAMSYSARIRFRCAGPRLRCGAGGYRQFAAKLLHPAKMARVVNIEQT
jgi:hypothetical protein